MARRTLIVAVSSAMLVPIGTLLVLVLNPHASFASGIRIILERGREHPRNWVVFAGWMVVFGLLGAGLSELIGRRKAKVRGFPVTTKSEQRKE